MHAFNFALLVLVAAAAVPIFAVPLSGRTRSDLLISNREMSSSVRADEGKLIEVPISRNSDDGSTYSGLETRHEGLDPLAARKDMETSVNDFLSSHGGYTASHVAKDRDFDPFLFSRDNEIQARNIFSSIRNFVKKALNIMTLGILR